MFSGWDYAVFALMLAVSSAIGLFYGCTGGKQKTTREFLLADRQMGVLPASLSLLASFMSAITVLGTPAEIYIYGTQYWMVWLGYAVMIPLAAHLYLPVFYRLSLTSVFEYLEVRFDKGIRVIASCIFILQTIMYLAIVLYTPALALNIVTGLNVWISVFVVGIVCTFYTTLGGMKAVMWTDVFQVGIMFIGLFAVIIKGSIDHGGMGNIWKMLEDGKRIEFFNVNPDPRTRHTLWSLTFGGGMTWLAIYGVNQAQVQRSLSCRTLRDGQKALWLNLPGLTLLLTICSLCGTVVYAQYRDCDPLTTKGIATDQLLPLYVNERLTIPCLPGLFTASVFSGALSTISSSLNSLSAVVLQDLLRDLCVKDMSEERATTVSKIIAVAFGVIMILLTFVASQMGGVLQAALGLHGMIGGPTLGLFTLAMLYPWVNTKGAYAGYISGLIATLWLGIGTHIYHPRIPKAPVSTGGCNITASNVTVMTSLINATTVAPASPADRSGYLSFYELSYLWYSAFGIITVTVVGLLASFLTGANSPDDVDPRLLRAVPDFLCCCFPSEWRALGLLNTSYSQSQLDLLELKKKKKEEELGEINEAMKNIGAI